MRVVPAVIAVAALIIVVPVRIRIALVNTLIIAIAIVPLMAVALLSVPVAAFIAVPVAASEVVRGAGLVLWVGSDGGGGECESGGEKLDKLHLDIGSRSV
jgi:hypothetical protein